MRQQPTFYRLDRAGAAAGRERPEGGPSMMVPLPPGWLCLQDCNLSGQLNHPVVVPFVLMHPDIGVALVDVAPTSNPEAEQVFRRRLDAARFDSIFPGFLPILHLRLDRADLPATEAILRDAFAAMPPLSVPGGDGWTSVVRRALLPRDPARATTHPGLSGDHVRRFPRDAAGGPPPEPDTEPDMLHREAVTPHTAAKPSHAANQSYNAESPVPAVRQSGPLPWIIMSGVGGLIAVLALFSLLGTGGDGPNTATETAVETPAPVAPAPPGPVASSKPPASPAAPPSPSPPPAAIPPPPAGPAAGASSATAGASAPPTPAQRPAAPPPVERLQRVTVRQPANLRTHPDGQANIVRVVPRGEVFRVHGRTTNGWVQVGDAEPRGWLHTSRLGDVE